jgi:hypothetical protein
MSDTAKKQIQALIDRETLGWNTKNADLFLDMIHPDMVWPWPPKPRDHDPAQWKFVLGRFNTERWRQYLKTIFANFDLVHNPLTSIRQSHGARWLVGRWVRMFVVQFVVMALYQRG